MKAKFIDSIFSFIRKIRQWREKRFLDTLAGTRAVDEICRAYSFERQFLGNGTVRIFRKKGEVILFDKTFDSLKALRQEFPVETKTQG